MQSFSTVQAKSLAGSYYGKVEYDGKKRQVAILLNSIEGEPENYYGVVMEYLNYFTEKNFILNFVRPGKKGYLEELLQWIRIYKFVREENSPIFRMHDLKVVNGEIITSEKPAIGSLVLNSKAGKRNPLDNAVLNTKIDEKPVTITMTSKRRFPLKSSWENTYVPGPYNPGYKQADITILDLNRDYDAKTKKASADFNVEKLKGKTLEIKGAFTVKQAQKGMYTFVAQDIARTVGAPLVQDKIGVFIDVYNAQPVMNTVELVLIDPTNPKNSQMYFEKFGNE